MNGDDFRTKRKIQQLGSSTLAMTLPAQWVREQNLAKGRQLVVQHDESDGSLLVTPDDMHKAGTEMTIDTSSHSPASIRRAVLGQYVLGRQFVHVESDGPLEPAVHETIAEIERQLLGFGIVNESTDSAIVRCSVDPADFELPTLMKQLWETESVMRTETVEALLSDDLEAARRALRRQDQVTKLFYLLLRIVFATYRDPRLNRTVGFETGFPLIGYRSVAQDVKLMAKANRTVASLVLESDGFDLDEEMRAHLSEVADTLDRFAHVTQQAVTAPTIDVAADGDRLVDALDAAIADTQAQIETTRPDPLLSLQRVLTNFEKSGVHVADSLDVATRFAYRSDTIASTEET